MNKIILLIIALCGMANISQAQLRPYADLSVRGKAAISNTRYELSALPFTTAKTRFEPAASLGVVWEKSGLGLQVEWRNASHNSQFFMKDFPLYLNSDVPLKDYPRVNFELKTLELPVFLTWEKSFGKAESWGLRARFGAGLVFPNQLEYGDAEAMRGEIMTAVTGEERPFEWMIVSIFHKKRALMLESGFGAFARLGEHLELHGNIFASHALSTIAYHRVWYWDNYDYSDTQDILTQGQSFGLQFGIRYRL